MFYQFKPDMKKKTINSTLPWHLASPTTSQGSRFSLKLFFRKKDFSGVLLHVIYILKKKALCTYSVIEYDL